jgi:uncharacterized protein (DUF111 family)
MARELGTLGVRRIPVVHRFVAERTMADVVVEIHGNKKYLPVKCGWMDGRIYTLKAEFDTARDWAADLDLPVRDVLRAIEDAAWSQIRELQKSKGPGDR